MKITTLLSLLLVSSLAGLISSLSAVPLAVAAESVIFVQPSGAVPIPAPVNGSNYLLVDCPACTGSAAPTGANNADAVASVATGLAPTVDYLFGYNGATWDRLLVDASKFLKVDCAAGCSGGTASNASSGVATSSTNGTSNSWLYGFNGTTWDQLQVDASKFLKVTIAAALPAGTNIIGKIDIDQTTPGTTNAVAVTNLPTTVDTNSGNKSASTLRVVLATDQPALTNKLLVTPDSVALPANQSVNISQVNAGTVPTLGTGILGTTVAPTATAAAGIAPVVSGAAESSHVLKASAGNFYSAYITTGATAGFFMIDDSATAKSNGAITPMHCIQVAANSSASISTRGGPPDVFPTGITALFSTTGCFTLTLSATAFFSGSVK